jgi:hypothetical protein
VAATKTKANTWIPAQKHCREDEFYEDRFNEVEFSEIELNGIEWN